MFEHESHGLLQTWRSQSKSMNQSDWTVQFALNGLNQWKELYDEYKYLFGRCLYNEMNGTQ